MIPKVAASDVARHLEVPGAAGLGGTNANGAPKRPVVVGSRSRSAQFRLAMSQYSRRVAPV